MKTFKPDTLQVLLTMLCNLLVVTVPLFFSFSTEELFEFNKMVLVYFYTLSICSVWAVRMIVNKQCIFKKTKLDIPIMLFITSQLLSTLFSIHPYTSLLGYYTRFHGGLVSTFCYVALYYAFVSNFEVKQLKGFFYSLFGSAVVVSLYGILEHFGHSFSCYLVTNGQTFDTSCWVQDVKNRVFATFGQPNWLAAYLIMILPVSLYMGQKSKVIWQKYLWIIVASLLFVTVLFTRSRSGILGLCVGLTMYLLTVGYVWWRERELQPRTIVKKHWSFLTALVICGLLFVFVPHPFSLNLSRLFSDPANLAAPTTPAETLEPVPANRLEVGGSDSGEIRKIVWKGALAVWKRYPILGSGVETFAYSYYLDRPVEHNNVSEWDFLYNKAHNEFLNFLATTGLVGLLTYCGLLAAFMLLTLKRITLAIKFEKYNRALLYASLISGITALSISNFFGFSTVMVTTLMFIFFAISEIFDVSLSKPLPETTTLTNWQYTLLVVVAVGSIFGTYKIYNYHQADVLYTKAVSLLGQNQLEVGLDTLAAAIQKNPSEALFYDTLANQYAGYALGFADAGYATQAAELARRANIASQATLDLNNQQLNYYKTRARVLISLSQMDPSLLPQAEQTLIEAHKRAPTDPKLQYNLALVQLWQGQSEQAVKNLQASIALKPDYELPRVQLAKLYEQQGNAAAALTEWQYILGHLNASNLEAKDRVASLSAQLQK